MILELDIHAARKLLPERSDNSHKGTFGHLFIMAGARGFTGAAKLVNMGAARSGVGLITVGVPYPLGDIVAVDLVESMSLRLPATEWETFALDALEPALKFAADKDAVVLGPGISRHSDTTAFVLDFVPQCPVPLLIDADGLNALSERLEVLHDAEHPRVLTPHPGEMARLAGVSTQAVLEDRTGFAQRLAEQFRCVVVLKGFGTVIAGPGARTALLPGGNSGLAKGGTGDLLSGLIGGLLAQGLDAFDAACIGVFLHRQAAELITERLSKRSMLARDVADALPRAWRLLEDAEHVS